MVYTLIRKDKNIFDPTDEAKEEGIGHKAWTQQEIGPGHVIAFVLMALQPSLCSQQFMSVVAPELRIWCYLGWAFYGIGLVPFGWLQLEFHTCMWHACVLAAGFCFHIAIELTIAHPSRWTDAAQAAWGGP